MAGKEFEILALDGHNFPTWATDIKVGLSTRGLFPCLAAPAAGAPPIPDPIKFGALSIIRNNIHPDLKSEYMYEEDPHVLWEALKNRYEQQKAIVLPEAVHEWNHLRFQDYKSVDEFNHAVHKLSTKLKFCDKEPSEADKIEKTLSTMLPAERLLTQQYREKGFTVYSQLIQSLRQAEKNHELTLWNSQQRPVGTAPLPEVHATFEKTRHGGSGNQPRNSSGKSKRRRHRKPRGLSNKGKVISKPKNDNSNKTACYKCGCYNHQAKKCRTPRHLVDLYMKSMGRGHDTQGKKYEAHFTSHEHETSVPPIPSEVGPTNTVTLQQGETSLGTNKMMVEYASNDIFGDFN
jgi:hypothetical protein